MAKPFRFTAQVPDFDGSLEHWQSELSWLADAGFSTIALADHFTAGYTMEPLVTLMSAAARCSLRVQTAVLGSDYRHPVLLHRAAATLDLLSEGRFELGLGAGWMRTDYEAAGLTMDSPAVRIDRLEEIIDVLEALFGSEPVTYEGKYFRVLELTGVLERCSNRTPLSSSAEGGGGFSGWPAGERT